MTTTTPAQNPSSGARGRRSARAAAAGVVGLLLLTGCTGGDDGGGGGGVGGFLGGGDEPTVELAALPAVSVLPAEGDRSVPASEALFEASPLVVLVAADGDVAAAGSRAEELGVPLLVVAVPAPAPSASPSGSGTSSTAAPTDGAAPTGTTTTSAAPTDGATTTADGGGAVEGAPPAAEPPAPAVPGADPAAVVAEVERLGAEQVLAADEESRAWAEGALDAEVLDAASDDVEAPERAEPAADGAATATPTAGATADGATAAGDGVLVLSTGEAADLAPAATARAAGASVEEVPGGDPRADGALVETASAAPPASVLALSPDFGDTDRLDQRMDVVETGYQLPGGGQVPFPGRHMIALYGSPGTPSLGVMGEQDVDAAVERAKEVAAEYDDLVEDPVVPTFEIITTVASASAGQDGDYSQELDPEVIRPWIEAAADAGVYVVLDLQPGRTDFLTQAQRYEDLLTHPGVGLALDPEWRLEPDQRHLRQVGQVGVDEVNAVGDWLAELVREDDLPPKVFLLHQFQTRMIVDRQRLDMSHDELVPLVHADGHGTPGQKLDTYRALQTDAPEGMRWGWKNFYDEDTPTMTPAETMAVEPMPDFVSYQ
ncbi:hypothetical protein [uncultured Pseudokineococcus sp.]|uniref:hypothetical protein n=1 Tax=uncultured Pseudokineococcus sp. TaxID=1642928 RepID=UPI002622EECE|nr:hypothetical protein [uncultured Pseudokineococcus sp.]